MVISALQQAISEAGLDGWLFFDHHRRDPIAYRVLGLTDEVEATRRWYYFVPAAGQPRKLVHRIEEHALDSLPGERTAYSGWTEQHDGLETLLAGVKRVAMQYSPMCSIPSVSMVDAGTIELMRKVGVEVASSADLVQRFESKWTAAQLSTHQNAGKLVDEIRRSAFDLIGERLRTGSRVTEYEVQQFILGRFSQNALVTDHGPIVAVNEHASDAHYEPNQRNTSEIKAGDLVLIDLWAKLNDPGAVYYDVTWTGYCGEAVPTEIENVFHVVKNARKQACSYVIDQVRRGQTFAGFQVDDAARSVIRDAGFGDYFFHRTGHSIGTDVHGTGANMDNYECHDDRTVLANTGFSVEPGIYLQDFGIRSEVNVYVSEYNAFVTGEEQEQLVRI